MCVIDAQIEIHQTKEVDHANSQTFPSVSEWERLPNIRFSCSTRHPVIADLTLKQRPIEGIYLIGRWPLWNLD
jgi:hypothetical protein